MASSHRHLHQRFSRHLARQRVRTIEALHAGPGDATAVHRGRVAIKKTRAAIRLIGDAFTSQELERQQSRLRLLARALAMARDAAARDATLDQLKERFGDQLPDAVMANSRRHLARRQREGSGGEDARYDRLLPVATEVWKVLELWSSKVTPRLLRRGLATSLTSAGSAFQRACKKPTAARLHRWRKRVKDLLYQCQLLRALGADVPKRFERTCAKLGECLGAINDLSLLRSDVRGAQGERTAATVAPLTRQFEKEQRRTAMRIGERIHSKRMTRLMHARTNPVPAHQA